MTPSITVSLRRLRDADPGSAGLDDLRWPGDASRGVLRDVLASDPGDDGETEVLSLSPHRTGRRTWVAPVLAAVVVLAVVAAVVVSHLGGAGRVHSAAVPSASPTAPSTQRPALSNRDKTVRLLDQLIAGVQPPPGARSVDHAPVASLRASGDHAPAAGMVRSAWWTAPGTLKGTLQYYKQVAHWPDHAVPNGTSVAKSRGVVLVAGLGFIPGEDPTRAYADLGLWIYVAPYRGGVALRAEVSAIVLPARTAAERVPPSATSVDVTVTRSGRPSVRRTLIGSALSQLAQLVNAQVPAVPASTRPLDCMGKAARKDVDRLSFRAPAGTVVVRVSDDRCPARAVEVVAAGTEQPALDGASTIDRAVIDALGLPPRYLLGP